MMNLYGIMVVIGVLAGMTVAYFEAKRWKDDTNHVFPLVVVVLALGFIGARLYHVIDQWSYYSQHPAQIVGGAGLGIFDTVIGGVIGLIIYTRWQRLKL